MLRPVRTAAPGAPVVTTAEVKAHAVVEHTDDDELLDSLTLAAIDHLDGWTGVLGRCLVNQTWRIDLCAWPKSDIVRLPFPDVSTINSVKYFDAANAEQTIAGAQYELLEAERGSLINFLQAFTAPSVYDDRSDAVQVTFVAGFGDVADVPDAIKTAIKMLVTHWYEHRGAVGGRSFEDLPFGVRSLLAPYRRNLI